MSSEMISARAARPPGNAVRAWTAATLTPADWLVEVPSAVHQEVETAIERANRSGVDAPPLLDSHAPLEASRKLMQGIRQLLDAGPGFAVLNGFSPDRYAKAELKAIYWLLSRLIARPVPQSPDGTLLHDVVDTGMKLSERVRGDLTNQELCWHTDNGFSEPPRYFGLAVLRAARQGGDSRVANLVTAHAYIGERDASLLGRLYEPFRWRRIGYQGEKTTADYPVYARDGADLTCRLNRRVIEAGYHAAGSALDAAGRDALDLLYAILDEPGFSFRYRLEPGQMQWMNNLALAHHRTAFVDWDEPDQRRHLVRVYLRDAGRATYTGKAHDDD